MSLATLLTLFMLASASTATPVSDFVSSYGAQSRLQRAAQTYEICTMIFSQSPQEYEASIHEMGSYARQAAPASYDLISTCQMLWNSRYGDVLKAAQIQHQTYRASSAYLLSQLDLIGSAKALSEEIRLYSKIPHASTPYAPRPPYEILSGLASSDRQLSETLSLQTKLAIKGLVSAAGAGIQLLLGARTFATLAQASSTTASSAGAEPALLVALLSWATIELADRGIWYYNYRDLITQLNSHLRELESDHSALPLAARVDEFYRATERLGHFYSYNVYLAESGQIPKAEGQPRCMKGLKAFFAESSTKPDLATQFRQGGICPDASTLWAGASLYLAQRFPNEPSARRAADTLMARSKNTFLGYLENEEEEKRNPGCGTLWNWIGCAR